MRSRLFQLRALAITAAVPIAWAGCVDSSPPLTPSPIPEVTAIQAIEGEVRDFDEYPGKVAPLRVVEIRARVNGYLTKILFKDGSEVSEGDELFEIDPRPYKAQVDLDKAKIEDAKAKLKLAEVEHSRYRNLRSRNVASQEDLDKAEANRDERLAQLGMAKAELEKDQLNLEWTKVTAPISGRTSRREVDPGSLIDGTSANATRLTSIVTEDPIYVNFDVDERKVQAYRKAAAEEKSKVKNVAQIESYQIPVWVGLTTDKGFPREGIIDFVDNQVNKTTGTVRARARLDNKDRALQAGYFARVRIRAGEPYQAVLIPERALGNQQGIRYVLVVDDQDKVSLRPVELGTTQDGGLRVITSGLSAGEWIVFEGLQRVRPGERVKPERKTRAEAAGK